MVNSHIQLPKGISKHFCNPDQKNNQTVYYLSFKTGEIKCAAPKKLGIERGRYPDVLEQELSRLVEGPIAKLNAEILKFANGESDSIKISQDDVKTAKTYIKASLTRSDMALDIIREKTGLSLEEAKEIQRTVIMSGLLNTGAIDDYLSDYKFTVLINKSTCQFVVPRSCFYYVESCGKKTIVAPISPIAALLLIPNTYPIDLVEQNNLLYAKIESTDDVLELNQRAVKMEYLYNGETGFVASAYKEVLEPLKLHLKYNRNGFNREKEEFLKFSIGGKL